MQSFRYEGRDAQGQRVQGRIESGSAQSVASWMREAGLTPVRVEAESPADAAPWWQTLGLGGRLGPTDLLLLTRQLAIMIKAGVPMLQALAGIQRTSAHPAMVELMQAMREDLDRGLDLSGAMARHPEVFSAYYVSVVRIGESTGRLDSVLMRLHAQLSFDADMRKKIKSALRYPSFVMVVLAAALAVLSIFVIPVFSTIYASMKVELPLLTRVLIGVSDFTVAYWWLIGALGIVLVAGARLVLGSPGGRLAWDRRKLKLPVIGSILAKGAVARFCVGLATAARSGLPMDQAFTLVSQVVDNAHYANRIRDMRVGIERGESILRVTQASGIFQPMELQMISVGEDTGALDEMLDQVAELYQNDVDYEVARLGESIEPIMLILIGGIVLVLMLGIFLPLWDLGQMARS